MTQPKLAVTWCVTTNPHSNPNNLHLHYPQRDWKHNHTRRTCPTASQTVTQPIIIFPIYSFLVMRLTFGSESPGEGLTRGGRVSWGTGGTGSFTRANKTNPELPSGLDQWVHVQAQRIQGAIKPGPRGPMYHWSGGQSKAALLKKRKQKKLCECLLVTRDSRQEHWQIINNMKCSVN